VYNRYREVGIKNTRNSGEKLRSRTSVLLSNDIWDVHAPIALYTQAHAHVMSQYNICVCVYRILAAIFAHVVHAIRIMYIMWVRRVHVLNPHYTQRICAVLHGDLALVGSIETVTSLQQRPSSLLLVSIYLNTRISACIYTAVHCDAPRMQHCGGTFGVMHKARLRCSSRCRMGTRAYYIMYIMYGGRRIVSH